MSKDDHTRENGINKSRYWNGILWLENLAEDWREQVADSTQLPGFYAIHDKDTDSQGAERKPHVHMTLVFPNTTTRKHAKEVFNLLSSPGKVACSTAQAAINIRHSYEYAIHNTEGARAAGKHQYGEDERICFNGFDIGFYEVVSAKEKHEMVFELSKLIDERSIGDMRRLFQIVSQEYDFRHFECFLANNAYFDRLCRGVYLNKQTKRGEVLPNPGAYEPGAVAMAGVIARGVDGTRIAVCEECGEVKTCDQFVRYGGESGTNIGLCRDCHERNSE